ncbi:hypothetical protein [Absidia glauca]|uniref:Uncharacterized protein n=1 Tax=Absidia glauca TaxID=4829 RepID=A0A168LBR3_ABSGL|nr:hypothetical protein [Absidia glauca]
MLQDFEVWGIDPGVSQVFVASNNSAPGAYLEELKVPDDELLAPPENVRHQIRTLSWRSFAAQLGFPRPMPGSRNGSKQMALMWLEVHIRTKMAVLDRLLMFYGQDIQQLRFFNYHGRQKATCEMVKIFVDGGRHPDQGNSFDVHQSRWKPDGSKSIIHRFERKIFRGKPSGLANAIKQAQRQHLLLAVDVNESWTSKVGSTCEQRTLDNLRLDHYNVLSKLHSVVACSVCRKLWQRDVYASRNIRFRAMLQVFGVISQVFTTFSSG